MKHKNLVLSNRLNMFISLSQESSSDMKFLYLQEVISLQSSLPRYLGESSGIYILTLL